MLIFCITNQSLFLFFFRVVEKEYVVVPITGKRFEQMIIKILIKFEKKFIPSFLMEN